MKNLVDEVRRRGGTLATDVAARAAIETVTDAIRTVTDRDELVRIKDFGTFKKQHRAQRTARNPKTGDPIIVAARDQLTFKAKK